jgi:membrane-bound lytic murein transglycosylase D
MLLIPTASQESKIYAYSSGQRQVKKNQSVALRSGKQKINYRVRRGDSFWEIARQHDVGVRELASWNQMAPGDPLRVGKELVIWQKGESVTASNGDRNLIRKIGYRVRDGDSFARIASRFNVDIGDIKRWHSKAAAAKYLQPGQHLTLYVDITRAR